MKQLQKNVETLTLSGVYDDYIHSEKYDTNVSDSFICTGSNR